MKNVVEFQFDIGDEMWVVSKMRICNVCQGDAKHVVEVACGNEIKVVCSNCHGRSETYCGPFCCEHDDDKYYVEWRCEKAKCVGIEMAKYFDQTDSVAKIEIDYYFDSPLGSNQQADSSCCFDNEEDAKKFADQCQSKECGGQDE